MDPPHPLVERARIAADPLTREGLEQHGAVVQRLGLPPTLHPHQRGTSNTVRQPGDRAADRVGHASDPNARRTMRVLHLISSAGLYGAEKMVTGLCAGLPAQELSRPSASSSTPTSPTRKLPSTHGNGASRWNWSRVEAGSMCVRCETCAAAWRVRHRAQSWVQVQPVRVRLFARRRHRLRVDLPSIRSDHARCAGPAHPQACRHGDGGFTGGR